MGVGHDRVLHAEEGFEQAAVGVEAGGIEDRVLRVEEVGDFLFEDFVKVLRSADKPDRGQAEAVLVQGLAGRLEDFRVVGQAEVVVGAKVQNVPRIAPGRIFDPDLGLLGGENGPLVLEEPRALDFDELLGKVVLDALVHGNPPRFRTALNPGPGLDPVPGAGGRRRCRSGLRAAVRIHHTTRRKRGRGIPLFQ